MADIREAILARLIEVIAAVPNIRSVQRNNTDWPEDRAPAALVLDGDEDATAGNDGSRPSNRPLLVVMRPEIAIVEISDEIGSDLTTFRVELMKLVLADATLNTLTGANGKISYLGCTTVFGWNKQKFGELQMRFEFKYPLIVKDL